MSGDRSIYENSPEARNVGAPSGRGRKKKRRTRRRRRYLSPKTIISPDGWGQIDRQDNLINLQLFHEVV